MNNPLETASLIIDACKNCITELGEVVIEGAKERQSLQKELTKKDEVIKLLREGLVYVAYDNSETVNEYGSTDDNKEPQVSCLKYTCVTRETLEKVDKLLGEG